MASKLSVSFNVTPLASRPPLDSRLKVKIEPSEYKAIAKHYGLTGGGDHDNNLLNAIQMVVQKHKPRNSAIHTAYGNPDDLIEAIGADIFNKQAKNGLIDADLNLVRELYLLLKVARKIHSAKDSTFTYSMFNNFERTNRYHYNNNKTLSGERNKTTSDSPLKDATAWTSYFKDVLAYESRRDGGKTFNENEMFNTIEIESVGSVSGKPEGGVNPAGTKGTGRRSAHSFDGASSDGRRGGDSGSSDSRRPKSDEESVNSDSDLRFTGGAGRRDSVGSQGGDSVLNHSSGSDSEDESVPKSQRLSEEAAVNRIQRRVRVFKAKKATTTLRKQKAAAAARIQAVGRGYSARAVYSGQKAGAKTIQNAVRSFKAQKKAEAHYENGLKSKGIKLLHQNAKERKRAEALKQIRNQICMQRAFKIWRELSQSNRSGSHSILEDGRSLGGECVDQFELVRDSLSDEEGAGTNLFGGGRQTDPPSPTNVPHGSKTPGRLNGINGAARRSKDDVSGEQHLIQLAKGVNGILGRVVGDSKYPNQAKDSSHRPFSPTNSGDLEMVSLRPRRTGAADGSTTPRQKGRQSRRNKQPSPLPVRGNSHQNREVLDPSPSASPTSVAKVPKTSVRRSGTNVAGQPTPPVRSDVPIDQHSSEMPSSTTTPRQKGRQSSRAKGSPTKPPFSTTSHQNGLFGNPFANEGTHEVKGRKPSSKEKRIETGQIKRSLSHQSLRSQSLLNSVRNQERRASANDAIINRQVWDSPEKDKAAEIRRGLADRYSKRVRIQNKSFSTRRGVECSRLIHEHEWFVSTSRKSRQFGLSPFIYGNLYRKVIPNSDPHNMLSKSTRNSH